MIVKVFFFLSLFFLILGALFWLFPKLGSLPGDMTQSGSHFVFYFPLVTSIVVSVILTILLNLFFFFFKR